MRDASPTFPRTPQTGEEAGGGGGWQWAGGRTSRKKYRIKGLHSAAGPLLASAWTCLLEAGRTSPRPADPRAFLELAWSGLGGPAGRTNK